MNKAEFQQYQAAGYNRIPITREVLIDDATPLNLYAHLAQGPYTYLFESVIGGEQWGRYSIIGLPCAERLEVRGNTLQHFKQDHCINTIETDDPLAWIQTFHQQFKVPTEIDVPRANGGLVGYFGYSTIDYIEKKLASKHKPDRLNTPDILLMVSNELLIFDNIDNRLFLLIYVDATQDNAWDDAQKHLDKLSQRLQQPLARLPQLQATVSESATHTQAPHVEFSESAFKQAVDRIKQYIIDGDVMQVVLSQRLNMPYTAAPLTLYRCIRHLNPSPYLFFLDLGDFQVVGSSPEILVRLEDEQVTVRPLAGTRPRGKNTEEDIALEKALLADPKELAEHLMLIDLGRNDIGRITQAGTVNLTEKMAIERYSHVMHIVSNVTGQLAPQYDAMDVLRATFPAGTLSGAPKVRAMEIIDELEPTKRGIYSGAVGYWGWNGNMDVAIAIRTAVIQNNMVYVQAGAGIVYDSVPENEWQETLNKARAMLKAVDMAQN